MKVVSNKKPLEIEILENTKIINFKIKKINNNQLYNQLFEYCQLKFDINFNDEEIKKEIEKYNDNLELNRINAIKDKAGSIIDSRYSVLWQLNHPRLDTKYSKEYEWIDSIRNISNDAEANGLDVFEIDWKI